MKWLFTVNTVLVNGSARIKTWVFWTLGGGEGTPVKRSYAQKRAVAVHMEAWSPGSTCDCGYSSCQVRSLGRERKKQSHLPLGNERGERDLSPPLVVSKLLDSNGPIYLCVSSTFLVHTPYSCVSHDGHSWKNHGFCTWRYFSEVHLGLWQWNPPREVRAEVRAGHFPRGKDADGLN